MSVKKTQIVLIVSALILFVLLFIAPKIAPKHSDDDGHDHSAKANLAATDANLEVYLNMALKSLDLRRASKPKPPARLEIGFVSIQVAFSETQNPQSRQAIYCRFRRA